jgi:hypothetical protein
MSPGDMLLSIQIVMLQLKALVTANTSLSFLQHSLQEILAG